MYSTEGRLARKFITSTKQALKSIAAVTDLLKQHFELPDFQSGSWCFANVSLLTSSTSSGEKIITYVPPSES